MNLLDRFNSPTPKRILALDGGGIRGALTLGYLQRIEDILREQNGNDPNFRLSDYFDMIGGTSTGSIIAACLATGMKVEDIKNMYFQLGGLIFAKKKSWLGKLGLGILDTAEFDSKPLETELHNLLGDITLGSDKIKTGICVVAKRADTNSTWPLINHPAGKYFNTDIGQNHTIPLWRAVRASAAAPTYFTPQVIEVGGDMSEAAFVDGGVSMANNPSLQMLMVATLKGFPFHWPLGKDNILIVSVGTGNSKNKQLPSQITKGMAIKWASSVPNMLMQDASYLNQVMLQWMSDSPTALSINGEIGKLEDDILGLGDKPDALISYLRYNTFMTVENLGKLMGKTYTQAEVDYLVEMSHADNRYVLYDIGAKAGTEEIMAEHFPEHFKIK